MSSKHNQPGEKVNKKRRRENSNEFDEEELTSSSDTQPSGRQTCKTEQTTAANNRCRSSSSSRGRHPSQADNSSHGIAGTTGWAQGTKDQSEGRGSSESSVGHKNSSSCGGSHKTSRSSSGQSSNRARSGSRISGQGSAASAEKKSESGSCCGSAGQTGSTRSCQSSSGGKPALCTTRGQAMLELAKPGRPAKHTEGTGMKHTTGTGATQTLGTGIGAQHTAGTGAKHSAEGKSKAEPSRALQHHQPAHGHTSARSGHITATQQQGGHASKSQTHKKKSRRREPMQIMVKTMMGQEIPVKIQHDATVEDLKMKLYRVTDMYPDQQVLIFNGEELDDDGEPLGSYRIQEGSTVHLLPRVSSGLVAC